MPFTQHVKEKCDSAKLNRLPCRGCTMNCSDYDHCDGKPWRLITYKKTSKDNKL